MEAVLFSPAQMHLVTLMSHIKSEDALDQLKDQLADFYARQVDEEMEELWEWKSYGSQENGTSKSSKACRMPIFVHHINDSPDATSCDRHQLSHTDENLVRMVDFLPIVSKL